MLDFINVSLFLILKTLLFWSFNNSFDLEFKTVPSEGLLKLL